MQSAPLWQQIWTVLKIRTIHRIRLPTIWIEVILPAVFFIFTCLFTHLSNPFSNVVETTSADSRVPFTVVPGPTPKFGIISSDTQLRETFLDYLDQSSLVPGVKGSSMFFKDFAEYQSFINNNRQVDESFYAVEITKESANNYTFKVSSNGMTIGSLPDMYRAVSQSALLLKGEQSPIIQVEYQPMPHKSVFIPDWYNGVNAAIFGYVFVISGLLATGTEYVSEAQGGVRDFLTFCGLTNIANNIAWLIQTFIALFIPSIFFTIAYTVFLSCNFFLVFLLYVVGCFAISSFVLMLISFYPKGPMGLTVGLGMLLTFFIFIFLGYFAFLTKVGDDAAKNVLSIFPHACLGYALFMVASGKVLSFADVSYVKEYSVKYAYVYLLMEGIIYYLFYLLIDYLKKRNWFDAPRTWKYAEPQESEKAVVVDHLVKRYGDFTATDDISFKLNIGDVLAIVGPNGAGKSTLMGLLSAAKEATSGSITFHGVNIAENILTMHKLTGFCPQENVFLTTLTPIEWLDAVATLRGDRHYDYLPIISALDLEPQLKKRVGDMSGGNKRKVCLAAALICDPPIVLLDEATSGVDFTSRTKIWSLVSSLKNKTIIMATHTLEECEKIVDKVMVLNEGKIFHFDTPTKLREEFRCGYILEGEKSHLDEIRNVIKQFNNDFSEPVEVTEHKCKFILPMDDSLNLSEILKSFDFQYLLTVQSLEEQIFENIAKAEGRGYEENDNDHEFYMAP